MKKKYQAILGAGFVLLVLTMALLIGLMLVNEDDGGRADFKNDLKAAALAGDLRLNLAVESALLNEGGHLAREIFKRDGEAEEPPLSDPKVDQGLAALKEKSTQIGDAKALSLIDGLYELRRKSARADEDLRAAIAAWMTAMNEGFTGIAEYQAQVQAMKNNAESYLQNSTIPGEEGPAPAVVDYSRAIGEIKKLDQILDKLREYSRDSLIDSAKEETEGLSWFLEWVKGVNNEEHLDEILNSPWQSWLKNFYERTPHGRIYLADKTENMVNKVRAGLVEYQLALGRRADLALRSKILADDLNGHFQNKLASAHSADLAESGSAYDFLAAGIFLILMVALAIGLAAAVIVRKEK